MLGVVTVRSAARRSIDAEIPVQHGRPRVLSGLRASNTGPLLLSLTVGAGAGGGAIAFRWLITAFTRRLSGHADYSAAGHAANPLVPGLGRWFMLLGPGSGRFGVRATGALLRPVPAGLCSRPVAGGGCGSAHRVLPAVMAVCGGVRCRAGAAAAVLVWAAGGGRR